MSKIISETGKNLDIVIVTKTAEDWRTFACWYSVSKKLPDARILLICNRTNRVELQYYQWAKRLQVPHLYNNPFCNEPIGDRLANFRTAWNHGLKGDSLLLLDYSTMVVDVLDNFWLSLMNDDCPGLIWDENVALSRKLDDKCYDYFLNNFMFKGNFDGLPIDMRVVCPEAKTALKPVSIVGTHKGCGRWIDTLKGCPFSNADAFIDDNMTINEHRIVGLWRKMVALYSVVN